MTLKILSPSVNIYRVEYPTSVLLPDTEAVISLPGQIGEVLVGVPASASQVGHGLTITVVWAVKFPQDPETCTL